LPASDLWDSTRIQTSAAEGKNASTKKNQIFILSRTLRKPLEINGPSPKYLRYGMAVSNLFRLMRERRIFCATFTGQRFSYCNHF